MSDGENKITSRQQAFVNAYVGDAKYNATEAARQAGYTGNYDSLRSVASRLLTKVNILRAIQPYIMTPEEVQLRLSEHGSSSLKPFLTTHRGQPGFDLSTEQAQEKLHLIKRVKIKQKSGGSGEKAWHEDETEIEVYDAQQALAHMARIHKLFVDRVEQTVNGSLSLYTDLADDELDRRIAAAEGREATEGVP